MKRSRVHAASKSAANYASSKKRVTAYSAARPAEHAVSNMDGAAADELASVSAAQPRSHHLEGLPECIDWLYTHPPYVISQNPPLNRVNEVTKLLRMPSSSYQRNQLQAVLAEWGVTQKCNNRKRRFDDVKEELTCKVVVEINRLYRLHITSTSSSSTSGASHPNEKYCTILTTLRRSAQR